MMRRLLPRPGSQAKPESVDQGEPGGPITNIVIADIVLRGAGILLRQRLEKGLISGRVPRETARRLVEERSIITTAALYGASRLATRSPLGLALVAGGLALKVLYDRGRRIEQERRSLTGRDG